MQTKTNPEQSLEVADRLFKSIERGDIAAIRKIYTPDVKIWHNNDGATQTVDAESRGAGWVVANISEVAYTEIRRHADADRIRAAACDARARKGSGKESRLPACISCDGREWPNHATGRVFRFGAYRWFAEPISK